MRGSRCSVISLALASLAFFSPPAHAIILLGSDDPALNTTAPIGALADGGWRYVGTFGWSTGTAISPHHFITAKHVGQPANDIVYQGKSYPILRAFEDPISDLRIFEIAGTFPNYAPLYSREDELGKNVVVIGRGTQRGPQVSLGGTLRGWQWGAGDDVQRWGENQISNINGISLYAAFDQSGGPNECMLSSGDSGGATFINDNGVWKLAGVNYSINSSVATSSTAPDFTAALFDTRGFYNLSHELITGNTPVPVGFYALRMSVKLPWIQSIIAPALANISARALVGANEDVAISGFIISGDPASTKRVLVRGIGPSLAANGIGGYLTHPAIELYDSRGFLLASNNGWRSAQETEILATGLAPTDEKEAAILATIAPGNYTAVLRAANQSAGGVGLVEVYDVDPMGNARLANLSARAVVGQGDDVLIAGVTLHSATDFLLLRASGPSLLGQGIVNPLSDPTIELRDSDGNLLAQNDNWRDNENAADISKSGLTPNDTRESALLLQPGPGSYTVIVRGAQQTSGVGLVEAFIVAP
ncbi:MAG: hypothetical protein ACXV8A_04385 [Chthoniobacterales bacterium]